MTRRRKPAADLLVTLRRRPLPPSALLKPSPQGFAPAPDVAEWLRDTFVIEGGPLFNDDHRHLRFAKLGVLWTNVPNTRQMRVVLATAEMPAPRGSKWAIARAELQLEQWFGWLPDFLITLSAPALGVVDDASFCATAEHELYHCAQAQDQWGGPKFDSDGRPIFAMRGHDVEQFVPIVARYGAQASGVGTLVAAAQQRPLLEAKAIAGACGTCLGKVA